MYPPQLPLSGQRSFPSCFGGGEVEGGLVLGPTSSHEAQSCALFST